MLEKILKFLLNKNKGEKKKDEETKKKNFYDNLKPEEKEIKVFKSTYPKK